MRLSKMKRDATLYPGARRLIAIDPGLRGTGWALWRDATIAPSAVGVLGDTAPDDTLANRCDYLASRLIGQMANADAVMSEYYEELFGPDTFVFIEMPQHMASAKGIAAQSGGIYKLTFLVGYLAARLAPCTVIVTNPGEWKGQLPKDVVQRRVQRLVKPQKCTALNIRSHAWDAVGIGLWAIGKL